jgi:ABC-type transport system involved in multi-copper enzyme maturation permease subunit
MYLWKAWHDSRTRVVLYILAALSVGVLNGLGVISAANYHSYFMMYLWPQLSGPSAIQRIISSSQYYSDFHMDITLAALTWAVLGFRQYMPAGIMMVNWGFVSCGPTVALLSSLSLGASSVGREYGAGTMNFVLTRPRPRINLVLADWTVGLTALVIVVGGLPYGELPFLYYVHARGAGNILAGLPALWALGAAIYGLTQFTTLVAGSAPKGLILSVATFLTYFFLPNALHDWWHTDALLRATQWSLRPFEYGAWPLSPFDWGPTGFWLAVAAGFLGASVAWIRFREAR